MVILVMSFLSVFNISLQFKKIIDAFIKYTGPGGPAHVLANLGNWAVVTRGFTYGMQTLLGDSILIYRCWKVYFENWLVVVFPILIWFDILACVLAASIIQSNLGQSSFTAKEISPFGTGFVSLTLSLNIIVTTMIAFRIWRTYSQSAQYVGTGSTNGQSIMKRVMWTVIESGAIYSTALLILLGVFVSKSEANIPMSDVMIQLIPIVFNVMIVRIHQNSRSDQSTGHESTIVWAERSESVTREISSTQNIPFAAGRSTVNKSFLIEAKEDRSIGSMSTQDTHSHIQRMKGVQE
ncbi:hypothetical protein BDZ94DRAFT_1192864 [Collybia nuda]|uniref:Uncharacterized protein n=1 Tax=Collybia nuda TaxID=64659 RepID=A0A9P5Y7A7_9AGAR|nr:hypothetical protein BDZ94DRAFT_1192864 [Collybia nuda]